MTSFFTSIHSLSHPSIHLFIPLSNQPSLQYFLISPSLLLPSKQPFIPPFFIYAFIHSRISVFIHAFNSTHPYILIMVLTCCCFLDKQKISSNTTKPVNNSKNIPDISEDHYCTDSEVMHNVTLRGGITSGFFRDRGIIPSVKECADVSSDELLQLDRMNLQQLNNLARVT